MNRPEVLRIVRVYGERAGVNHRSIFNPGHVEGAGPNRFDLRCTEFGAETSRRR